jgi:phosphopantetheine--protein transferase-like protein
MNNVDQLREMLSTMLMLPPEQITAETSLASLDTSLGGARLKLGLKRLGLSMPAGASPTTFGELEAALFGNAMAKAAVAPSGVENDATSAPSYAGLAGVQVGIDVQDVNSLPTANDYWEHEFYVGMFDKSEIASAVVQSDPRTHLAGYWCAKEALRKCDPSFMKVGFESIVVAHERDGRPYMQRQTASGLVRLPHALSLSHTGQLATAVVIAVAPLPEPAAHSERAPSATLAEPAEAPPSREPSRIRGSFLRSVALLVTGALVAVLVLHYWRQ